MPWFFWLCRKMSWQKKLEAKVNLKIYSLTSWTQTIGIKILSDISKSKNNQSIKLVKLIEYNVRNSFLQKSSCKYQASSRFLSVSKKNYIKQKLLVSTLVSICFGIPRLVDTIKINCMILQNVDSEICSILILKKGLGVVSPRHFCMIF